MSANGLGWDVGPGGLEPFPTLPSTPYPTVGSYPLTPPTTRGSGGKGAAGGAATGAQMGMFGGPIGMGVGAGIGALVGWLVGRKKKKPSPQDQLIQQLLQQQMQQYQQQQPLRDMVQSMAMNRLRAVYPNGVPGLPPSTPLPPSSPTPSGGSDRVASMLRLLVDQDRLRIRPEMY